MNNPFQTPGDYEQFLYNLPNQFPSIQRSTMTFVRRGATLARIAGEIFFAQSIRLIVRERVSYDRLPIVINGYGYEVWQNQQKLYWYDSQPHPDDESLQETHPHHKHIPPDIKHNRIPAPEMSFTQPNIPALIGEIEKFLATPKK